MYKIIIWRQGEPSSHHNFTNYEVARQFYHQEALRWDRYTQLLVYGISYTTAQAERFFHLGMSVEHRAAQ